MKPRVIIADDHLLFVEGIWRVVEAECDIVASCSNGRDLVALALRLLPDIVLLDISMPSLNGMEAARQVKVKAPGVKIIFVTMMADREYIREAFQIGASGYLSKDCGASELNTAINQVMAGRYAFSPTLNNIMIDAAVQTEENPACQFGALTPRQREVLQLVGEGRSAKQIAQTLNVSVKTVEFHKKRLMLELRLRNSAELIRYTLQKSRDSLQKTL